MIAEELQAVGVVRGDQHLQHQAAEQPRQHLHRQEVVGTAADPTCAVERYPATRYDHVHVRVMRHRGAPGVEHRREADPDAQALGIGRNRQHCLRRSLEQEIVDDGLVLVGDGPDPHRQREHDVEVRDGQQLGLALLHPCERLRALALGTMPVAAAVIGDRRVRAVLAAHNMPAESRCAAALDRRHHLQLAEAHVASIGFTPSGPVVAEDIRDLQNWTGHQRRASGGRLVLLGLQAEMLQRAHDRADGVGGDARVERRRIEFGMSE